MASLRAVCLSSSSRFSSDHQKIKKESSSQPSSSAPSLSPEPRSHPPTNEEVEAVIKMATSTRPTPDGRPPPGKDTRTQLFVGNVSSSEIQKTSPSPLCINQSLRPILSLRSRSAIPDNSIPSILVRRHLPSICGARDSHQSFVGAGADPVPLRTLFVTPLAERELSMCQHPEDRSFIPT